MQSALRWLRPLAEDGSLPHTIRTIHRPWQHSGKEPTERLLAKAQADCLWIRNSWRPERLPMHWMLPTICLSGHHGYFDK